MSDYTIDETGITLSTSWQEHDHLNVRTESGTTNFHAEAKCANVPAPPECSPIMQAAAQRIGDTFIPWSDLGLETNFCVEWLQFSRSNYHFGEHGESPVCVADEPVQPEPPVRPEDEVRETVTEGEPDCDGGVVTVTTLTEAAGHYLGDDGEWHLGDWFPVESVVTVRDATGAECPVVDEPEQPEEEQPGTPVDEVPDAPVEGQPADEQPVQDETPAQVIKPVVVEAETVEPVEPVEEPVQLAQTGGVEMLTLAAFGTALAMAGVTLLARRLINKGE